MKVRRRHGVNWNAYAYQARVTGYGYDTEYCLWSDEWNWKGVALDTPFDIDFDGFISAECLLQEAKGDYDQFIGEDGKSEPWFGGFKKCPRSSSDRLLRFIPIHQRNSVGISKRRTPENGCCPYCSDTA